MDGTPVAVFSDVHANLEALDAMLSDAKGNGIGRFVCLGDVVGYGPDPVACLDVIMELGCPVILGNHDLAVRERGSENGLNDYAAAGILHARSELGPGHLEFLARLPLTLRSGDILFAHGSVEEASPWDYVLNRSDYGRQFLATDSRMIFLGHTHRPALWRLDGRGLENQECVGTCQIDSGARYIANVGSVGQPRNMQPEACYVIFTPGCQSLEFRLVKYDFRLTQKKIARAGLPRFLGQRLALGR